MSLTGRTGSVSGISTSFSFFCSISGISLISAPGCVGFRNHASLRSYLYPDDLVLQPGELQGYHPFPICSLPCHRIDRHRYLEYPPETHEFSLHAQVSHPPLVPPFPLDPFEDDEIVIDLDEHLLGVYPREFYLEDQMIVRFIEVHQRLITGGFCVVKEHTLTGHGHGSVTENNSRCGEDRRTSSNLLHRPLPLPFPEDNFDATSRRYDLNSSDTSLFFSAKSTVAFRKPTLSPASYRFPRIR